LSLDVTVCSRYKIDLTRPLLWHGSELTRTAPIAQARTTVHLFQRNEQWIAAGSRLTRGLRDLTRRLDSFDVQQTRNFRCQSSCAYKSPGVASQLLDQMDSSLISTGCSVKQKATMATMSIWIEPKMICSPRGDICNEAAWAIQRTGPAGGY
jgi:hypothetical protein